MCNICSVGWSAFFNAELFFLGPCLFRRLVRNFSLELLLRRFKNSNTRAPVYVWVSLRVCGCPVVRAYGCGGVWVSVFLFILVCLRLFQQHAAQCHLQWSQHDMIGSLRGRMATFQYGKLPKWEDPKLRAPNKRKLESICVLPNRCMHGPRPTQSTRQRDVTS